MPEHRNNQLSRKPASNQLKQLLPPSGTLPPDWRHILWWKPVLSGLFVHSFAMALLLVVVDLLPERPVFATVVGAGGAIVLAPLYRGLENLVHGASHFDIAGNRRAKLNDFVGDLVAALPVFQTVSEFREPHLKKHHSDFNGDKDPCKKRHAEHPDVLSGELPSLWKTLAAVPRDAIAFYRVTGSNIATLMKGLLWHVALYVSPLIMLSGSATHSFGAWVLIFGPLFSATLPIVRCLAEMGEHDYRNFKTEGDKNARR